MPIRSSAQLLRMQSVAPVTRVRNWDGKSVWLVSDDENVRSVLTDARFSAVQSRDEFPHAGPGLEATKNYPPTMLTLDNPEHDIRRRMLAHFFMPKRVETFRPQVQTLVDSLIDSMLAATGTVELVEDFALPIPSTIISHILGVPHEDHEFFQLRAKAFLYNTMGNDDASG